jgi:hypothetical protein
MSAIFYLNKLEEVGSMEMFRKLANSVEAYGGANDSLLVLWQARNLYNV